MITLRPVTDLGTVTQTGVTIRCHFSFAEYQDPTHLRCGQIRAINRADFATFAEFWLEKEEALDIVTIVLTGTFFAEAGGQAPQQIHEGDIHLLSAGQGIHDALWWASSPKASFIQIWLLPDEEGGMPEMAAHHRPARHGRNVLAILASGFPEDAPEDTDSGDKDEPLPLRASARVMGMLLQSGVTTQYSVGTGRCLYLVVLSGSITLNDEMVGSGDGAAIYNETELRFQGETDAIILVIDTA